jgi:hypothetical protein
LERSWAEAALLATVSTAGYEFVRLDYVRSHSYLGNFGKRGRSTPAANFVRYRSTFRLRLMQRRHSPQLQTRRFQLQRIPVVVAPP